MLKLGVCIIIFCLLTSCTNAIFVPDNKLIKKAIALQLTQTQQQLTQQLGLDFKGFEVNHLRIFQRETLRIQKLKTYHLIGIYDLKFNLPNRQLTQDKKSFDIYLQLQTEEKTWRLLLPNSEKNQSEAVWGSYFIE